MDIDITKLKEPVNIAAYSGTAHKLDFKYSNNGKPYLRFSLRRSKKDKKTGEWVSHWFNCVVFGGKAEEFKKAVGEKDKVIVLGYTDYESRDGKEYWKTIVTDFLQTNAQGRAPMETVSEDVPF